MNCKELRELLSEGRLLTGSAEDHLASCAGCRAMVEALTLPEAHLDRERIDQLQALITTSLTPVRPLPSNRMLISSLLAVFAVFSLIAAIPVGYFGFHVLNTAQKFAYYTVILLCAMWFSVAMVHEMIPGSKETASPGVRILTGMLSLALVPMGLFHNFDLHRFVPLGIPCLRLGLICAVVSGALFWFVLRKGFFTSPAAAGATAGCFAGLAGVAVLALHCPILNSAHIIIWHLGAMVVAVFGGVLVGFLNRPGSL